MICERYRPPGRFITLLAGGRKPFPILRPISNPRDATAIVSRGQVFRDSLTLHCIRKRPAVFPEVRP
jgi:hypothetical protein